MQILSSEKNGVLIIAIDGRLTLASDAEFKAQTAKYFEGYSKVVFDCSKMEYLDSTGLGLIVRFYKDFTAKGGKFALAALQSKPKLVFEITRAYKIFNIFDSVDAAIASL